jgi:hypothetical protein
MLASIGNIILNILKAILLFCLKLIGIVLALTCKLSGTILLQIGEGLEKMIMK